MYLFNRMRELYETAGPDTTEYILAQYFLLNIRRLDQLSIAGISKDTAISKSAVSKFVKGMSFEQGFAQFKGSLEFEMQFNTLDYQTLARESKSMKNLAFCLGEKQYCFSDFVQKADIEKLAKTLKQKNRFIFCGNDSKKNYFHSLINCLLLDGKDAKFVSWIYSDQQIADLSSLDEQTALIVVDPSSTIFDFFLRITMAVEMAPDFDQVKTEKYYIGRPSKNNEVFYTIGIETTRHLFIDDMVLNYFTSQLLLAYLQKM